MTDLLADFKQFVIDAEPPAPSQYAKWAHDNPWDLSRWVNFRDGILTGKRPEIPVMSTPHGRELIDAGKLFLDATLPTPPPPPTPVSDDPVPSETLWQATFEDGTFNEFDGGIQAGPGRCSVITQASALGGPSAARKGSRFAQFLVKSGDNYVGGERAEALRGQMQAVNGKEFFYGYSLALPSNFPITGSTGPLLGDFHSNSNYLGSDMNVDEWYEMQANVQLVSAPNRSGINYSYTSDNPGLGVGINDGLPTERGQYDGRNGQSNGRHGQPYTSDMFDLGKLTRDGSWFDICFRIRWSDAGQGLVAVFRRPAGGNWQKMMQLDNCSNMYPKYSAYLKIGINRAQNSGLPDGIAWYDAVYGPSPAPPKGLTL